jgi:molybdopterin-guanine dinucleotide biosynthesis protein A
MKGDDVVAVILAGGRSSRFSSDSGQNKAWQLLRGKPLIAHVAERLREQVKTIYINANDSDDSAIPLCKAVIPDGVPDSPGPLAGLVSAMEYLDKNASSARSVLVVPCDGPFLPLDLTQNLISAIAAGPSLCAVASYEASLQPVYSLWHRSLKPLLEDELKRGHTGFKKLLLNLNAAQVDWPSSEQPINPFFNINTPQDMALAESWLEQDHES